MNCIVAYMENKCSVRCFALSGHLVQISSCHFSKKQQQLNALNRSRVHMNKQGWFNIEQIVTEREV